MPALIRQSKLAVTPADAKKSLVDFLCGRFTYHDRARWLDEIQNQRLQLNGILPAPDTILASGDILEYFPTPRPEPPVDFNTSILEIHGNLVFLDKAGNIPCHPAGCFFNHTLWAQLITGEIPGLPPLDDIHFVSRLDRETSGIVLVATSSDAMKAAEAALAQHNAAKEYRVLVEGDFPDSLDADGFLWNALDAVVEKRRRFSTARPDFPVKKLETARTLFRCIRRADGMSELAATLLTGRTHQIRATLRSLGFPVVGDKVYGVDETIFLRFAENTMTDDDRRRLRMPRQALHAYRLRLTLPGESSPRDIVAPCPFSLAD